ncbi:hypothetical protein [uncultured Haemophilus sp.]|nr:hypothetical protein [uncultured Haemophilus sp.]
MLDEFSDIIYEHASNLYEAGLLNKKTMQEFDVLYLTSVQPDTKKDE